MKPNNIDAKVSSFRVDFLNMPLEDSYMEERFVRTPEGFLKGRAIVTNVGVFQYKLPSGSMRNELRPPEEVFSFDSKNTLQGLPLANEHPATGVIDIDNIKKVQVGYSGDDVRRDEYHLSVPLIWTDADTIEDIKAGKRGLSAGYSCDIEDIQGVWMGTPYDAIQKNIRYNHIVVTEKARAGDNARIKLDSSSAVGIQNNNKSQEGVESMLKKIKIDGVEYEAEAPVITAYTQTQSELEAVKADSAKQLETIKIDSKKIEAERDQLKEENEKLKTDSKKFEETKPEELEKAVQARLVILDSARRAEVEVKSDMTETDVKKAVVTKLFPNSKEKMDSADEVYVNARFDMALEKLEEIAGDKQDNSDDLRGDSIDKDDPKHTRADSQTAYKRMIERDQKAWNKSETEVN